MESCLAGTRPRTLIPMCNSDLLLLWLLATSSSAFECCVTAGPRTAAAPDRMYMYR